jgi:hypothetical protein
MRKSAVRRPRLPVRRSAGTSNARNPAKLSELTRPEATSSASASSTCGRNSPVPSTSSSKNEAPYCRMKSATACAFALHGTASGPADCAAQSGVLRRARNVIGVVRTGVGLRSPPLGRVLRGRSRAQAIRPDRH